MEFWRESYLLGAKSEARSSKHETNPKSHVSKPVVMSWSLGDLPKASPVEPNGGSDLPLLCLGLPSCLGFRASCFQRGTSSV